MRWISRTLGALAVPAWLLISTQTGLAQPPTEDSETADEVAPETPASDALANRMRELEARDEAREQRLSAALERVEQLEQGAVAAQHAAQERAAAEAAAAEATAEAEEAEEEGSGPTIRPLATMLTRFERREGYAQLGRGSPGCVRGMASDSDCLRYRARVGMEIDDLRVGDDIVAAVRFLPQVSGNWAGATGAPTSGGIDVPNVGMYEGYLRLNIAQTVRLDVGRFSMAYGEHLIIGTLGWHPAARSFDGTRMRIQPDADGIWVDAFWTMLREGLDTLGDTDRAFYGIYAGLGSALGEGVELDVYALGLQDNNTENATGAPVPWSLRVILGSRFRHRIGIVDLRAEGALQTGRQGRPGADAALILAGNIEAEVGLNFADNRFRVALEGAFASGDDPTTLDVNEANNDLFPTGHAFLGLMDITGRRTNIGAGVLNLMVKPLPQLVIKLETHLFMRPEAGAGPEGVDNFLGGEGDLNIIWTPGAGFRVRGLYGLFIPNGGFTPNLNPDGDPRQGAWGPGSDPVHYIELELLYTLN